MALRLTLENEQTLPDGGPVFFHVTGKRSVDIGRDRHLDWTLPDPTRMISGKHCEVHYREGGYWLHDVSTNGTFLNGADQRMRGPHRLRNGDRFIVGHYIVGVSLDASDEAGAVDSNAIQSGSFVQQHADYREIWSGDREMAPPIDPQQLKIPREAARPINAEFLDWAAAVPEPDVDRSRHSPFRTPKDSVDQGDMNWASGSLAMPKPAPPPPVAPSPRRPVWTDDDASWGDDRPAARQNPPPPQQPEPPPMTPPPRRPAAPAPAGVAPDSGSIETAAFVRQLARAAGLPEEFFANRDSAEVAEQLGAVLRINVESVMSLLQARTQAKQLTRSSSQTMIQAIENNPLKFSPTPEDAMRIMFGPRTQSYLDARSAFVQSFSDLKSHQLKTYMAMQHAVAKLIGSIDPVDLARQMEADGGAGTWLGSSKGKLWDAFLTHWKAHLGRDGNAPIDAFMAYFADYYDRGGKTGPE
jgi:type VI secretion system protein ImpI